LDEVARLARDWFEFYLLHSEARIPGLQLKALAQKGLVTAVGRSERDPLRKYFWRSTQGIPKGTRKHSASWCFLAEGRVTRC
jgi:hypothetical protein